MSMLLTERPSAGITSVPEAFRMPPIGGVKGAGTTAEYKKYLKKSNSEKKIR